jgi:hypothetical protein
MSCSLFEPVATKIEIYPPFIYSNVCRNDLFSSFAPVIIYGSIFDAVVNPVVNFMLSRNITDLERTYKLWFGFEISAKNIILQDVTSAVLYISEQFALLLIYGIVSPYCAIAIELAILVKISVLCSSIFRYYDLQDGHSRTYGRKFSMIPRDEHHIEVITETAQRYFHVLSSPGLLTSSFIFSFFLFDMAYDNPDRDLRGAASMFSLTVVGTQLILIYFFYYDKRQREDVVRLSLSSLHGIDMKTIFDSTPGNSPFNHQNDENLHSKEVNEENEIDDKEIDESIPETA